MALSASRLGGTIKSGIESAFGGAPIDDAKLTAFCNNLATAIVTEITVNAQVAVASVSGVTAGGASSGPGTGTVA